MSTDGIAAGVLAFAACCGVPPAHAAAQLGDGPPTAPVPDARLAALRGGYDLGGGLQASFGIERAVWVNGQLVAAHSVHLPDLSRITATQAQGLQNALAGLTLVIQAAKGDAAGTAATVISAGNGSPGSTLIQNSADGQAIRALTVLNASSNSLQLLRGTSAGAALRDALTQPLGPR